MTNRSFYCGGTCCSQADKCKHHQRSDDGSILQYLDFSTMGWCTSSSKNQDCIDWYCGDNGKYKMFEQKDRE